MEKPEVVWKATGRPLEDDSKASETLRYFYAQNLDRLILF